jgi:class 3 adenylate cyclase
MKKTDGVVTEYLGDGLLALFQFPFDDTDKREKVCEVVMGVARECLEALQIAVNPILNQRYSLPSLKIGVGMSYSQSIITHFGIEPNTQVKVIGRCIYDVSKLSKGENEIAIHEKLKKVYPSSKEGKLSFFRKKIDDIEGYVLKRC